MGITANLISFWELEEASGTRIDAVKASANNLADNATVTQNPGKVNQAAQFTLANSEFLSIASNASLQANNIDITICAWTYLDTKPTTNMAIVAKQGAGAGGGDYILFYAGSASSPADRFVFELKDSAGGDVVNAVANTFGSASTATWYFVVGWFDAAAGVGSISVNDGGTDTNSKTGTPSSSTVTFRLGARDSGDSFYDGRIDQVGFWKRVLTAAERTWLYNQGNGRSYSEMAGSGQLLKAVGRNEGARIQRDVL